MPDKIDPKKVAERLAGGGTLKQEQVKIEGQSWVLSSAQTLDCPHCGKENRRFVPEESETIHCSYCNKAIRILDREVKEAENISIPEDALEKLMASMNRVPMSIGYKVQEDPGNK